MSKAMMATTTSSSISVKPLARRTKRMVPCESTVEPRLHRLATRMVCMGLPVEVGCSRRATGPRSVRSIARTLETTETCCRTPLLNYTMPETPDNAKRRPDHGCIQGIEARIERRWHTHQQRPVGPVGAKDRSHGWRPPKADRTRGSKRPEPFSPGRGVGGTCYLVPQTSFVANDSTRRCSLHHLLRPVRGGRSLVGSGNHGFRSPAASSTRGYGPVPLRGNTLLPIGRQETRKRCSMRLQLKIGCTPGGRASCRPLS